MGLWQTIKQMVTLTKELPVFLEQKVEELAQAVQHVPNPYLDDQEADAVYETLENGIHAVWPLLKASEYAGTMAARGIVWGALYAFTGDETREDQMGIAWELATLVQEYLPENQDPAQMPGVLGAEGDDLMERIMAPQAKEGIHMVHAEILAFMDAALSGNNNGAALVTDALRTRIGALSHAAGNYEALEDAEKVMAINFLGTCLASLADKYSELEMADGSP